MRFAIYLPRRSELEDCPVLFYLSGLTCTEQNAIIKAGAQRYCADRGLIFVCPDTSPRGNDVPDDEADDLGQGASFYVDAITEPWSRNYRMYDYIVNELRKLVLDTFPASARLGLTGHSMGGHGALVCALRNPNFYASVSALAPIAAPSQCPWGQKAFTAYLGPERELWHRYDATQLMLTQRQARQPILIDQGEDDPFLDEQLKPQLFQRACRDVNQRCELRMQPGYDHSYYFVSTFIEDHIAYHADALGL